MVTVISGCVLDAHCYFLVWSEWSLFLPIVLWIVPAISWCALDGHYYFLVCSEWSLLFLGALWMVIVFSGGAVDGHCYFMVHFGWSLLFHGVLLLFPAACKSKTCHTQANTRQSTETAPTKKNIVRGRTCPTAKTTNN